MSPTSCIRGFILITFLQDLTVDDEDDEDEEKKEKKEAVADPEVLAKLTVCLAMYSDISILTVN